MVQQLPVRHREMVYNTILSNRNEQDHHYVAWMSWAGFVIVSAKHPRRQEMEMEGQFPPLMGAGNLETRVSSLRVKFEPDETPPKNSIGEAISVSRNREWENSHQLKVHEDCNLSRCFENDGSKTAAAVEYHCGHLQLELEQIKSSREQKTCCSSIHTSPLLKGWLGKIDNTPSNWPKQDRSSNLCAMLSRQLNRRLWWSRRRLKNFWSAEVEWLPLTPEAKMGWISNFANPMRIFSGFEISWIFNSGKLTKIGLRDGDHRTVCSWTLSYSRANCGFQFGQ